MTKYIDAEKLIKSVNNYQEGAKAALNPTDGDADYYKGKIDACKDIQEFITSLQQERQEVDLERDAVQFCFDKGLNVTPYQAKTIANHFYKFGKTEGDMDYLDKDKLREWDEFSLKNRIYNEANKPEPTGGKEIRG